MIEHAKIDFASLLPLFAGRSVERPNRHDSGTLSGHAAGEPFEKLVYRTLKELYPREIYKQYEYLNSLYAANPLKQSVAARHALIASHTGRFLLNRGVQATKNWRPDAMFEEKQNDTADILYVPGDGRYGLIDVKTCNTDKKAMPPNIISAYKLAHACRLMLEHDETETIDIDYIEIAWRKEEGGENLVCTGAHHADLFKCDPSKLYINWAAGLQIQFHVSRLEQNWTGSRADWAKAYLKAYTASARRHIEKMTTEFIAPFADYAKGE